MKNHKLHFILTILLLSGSFTFAQINCETIQCDCENIPDAEKDPGLIELCKFYEQNLRELCKTGETELKCKENAKGPNAWPKVKQKISVDLNNLLPIDNVDISKLENISTIKYCNQLMAFTRKNGFLFGNVRIPAITTNNGYFKEAWAYDLDGTIYVIVVLSKRKNSGYDYKLSVKYRYYKEYQYYIYCGVNKANWKKFNEPCSECDYDKRFTDNIKMNECDCL